MGNGEIFNEELKRYFEHILFYKGKNGEYLGRVLFEGMSKEEIYNLFCDERVVKMIDFDQQNSHHIFSLFSHSLVAVENIFEFEKVNLTGDHKNTSIGLSNNIFVSDEDFSCLVIAAFFHDIGKIETQGTNKKDPNKKTYYGHPKRSKEIAVEILVGMGYSQTEIDRIAFLIEHHEDFINFDEDITYEKFLSNKIIKNALSLGITAYDFKILTILCEADAKAQNPEFLDKKLKVLKTIREHLDRLSFQEFENLNIPLSCCECNSEVNCCKR